MTQETTYKIVTTIEGRMVVDTTTDIFAWAEVRGHEFVKLNDNHRQRAELQGQPIFAKLVGPMWDGNGVIRYEDSEANDRLSA